MNSIAFIDTRINDYQTILAALPADMEWFLINPDQDGITQIETFLQGQKGYDSLHIFSHGSVGTLYLGSTVLTATNIESYASTLKNIGYSLTNTGDILLYGCNIADGLAGQQFIETLAGLTGADVAASNDISGLSGNWNLEIHTGTTDSPIYINNLLTTLAVGDDSLVGTEGNDTILGLGGNDTLLGLDGNDSLQGGTGNDSIAGGNGNDTLEGADDDDFLAGGKGNDSIEGGLGNDYLLAGEDVYSGETDTLMGGDGNDTLSGYGNAILNGGDGNDSLSGATTQQFIGGAGNDTMYWSPLVATPLLIDGGDGYDFIKVGADMGQHPYLNTLRNIEEINFSMSDGQGSLSDQVVSTDATLKLWVENSNHLNIDGSAESDGQFWMIGGKFGDSLIGGSKADTLEGGDGDDTVKGNAGNDLIDGGLGTDTAIFSGNYANYTLTYGTGEITIVGADGSDILRNINRLQFDDQVIDLITPGVYLIGTEGNDDLDGDSGDDFLDGKGGDDDLSGGEGDDKIEGGSGRDKMQGGNGDDFYHVDNLGDLVSEVAGEGNADKVITIIDYALDGNIENLQLGSGASKGTGNALDNVIEANDDGNELQGGGGKDHLKGGKGKDKLQGGDGDDHVDAGEGDDEIVGGDGAGNDTYIGGIGIDTVRYTSAISIITVNLTEGAASGNEIGQDTLSEIENLIGGQMGDTLIGDIQANNIDGYTGNDTITGGNGDDKLLGGLGTDQAVYGGNFANYSISVLPGTSSRYQITDLIGNEGTDTLSDIEYLVFTDQTIKLNSAPEIATPPAANFIDTGVDDNFAKISGNLSASDIDGDVLTYNIAGSTGNSGIASKTGTYGTLSVNTSTGSYDFVPNDSVIEALKVNTTESFTIIASDGLASTEAIYTVTIAGANDLVSFEGDKSGIVSKVGTTSATGQILALDRDQEDTLFFVAQSNQTTAYGNFTISESGTWSYDLNNKAAGVLALKKGHSITETIAVTTSGGETQDITLVVKGGANTSTSGNDNINSGGGDNTINAGDGKNTVTSGSGNDNIASGIGNDTINAGNGDNTINAGNGANKVNSGTGNDTIDTGLGNDTINAGDGNNTVNAGGGTNKITTGSGDDALISGDGKDTISAGDGNNTINAGGGSNKITSGSGLDHITTGNGNDTINAGDGDNTINAGAGNNKVTTGNGHDSITAGDGNDTISAGAGNNIIHAGNGINKITSGTGDDAITTGIGKDTILASDGNNIIDAGAGNDKIVTGTGNDEINAGAGKDVMTGGSGDDVFVFDNLAIGDIDKILDFDRTHDLLKFDDAVFTALAGGLSSDNFVVGARAVAHDNNDFLLFDINKHQLLYDADGNGAGAAITVVTLAGVNTVNVDDFWVY